MSHQQLSGIEPTTQVFVENLSKQGGPPIYQMAIADARKVLSAAQGGNVPKLAADIEDRKIAVGPDRDVSIRVVRPKGRTGTLPAVMYFHGGGWVLGDKETHDRLVREIANGTQAAVVFVNYTHSPEARYPVPIEEAYAATTWIAENGSRLNIDGSRLAVVGDSVGGNMAAAVTLLSKERRGPKIVFQVLLYPVTNADFESASYQQFADGPWLTREAMKWFWNQYAPDVSSRNEPTASPLHAGIEQLRGLPPALVITDEFDVLRDEGEAYAHRLSEAGIAVTAVRYLGTIHDFAMLNALAQTPAARGAIHQVCDSLRMVFAR